MRALCKRKELVWIIFLTISGSFHRKIYPYEYPFDLNAIKGLPKDSGLINTCIQVFVSGKRCAGAPKGEMKKKPMGTKPHRFHEDALELGSTKFPLKKRPACIHDE